MKTEEKMCANYFFKCLWPYIPRYISFRIESCPSAFSVSEESSVSLRESPEQQWLRLVRLFVM